MCTISFPSTWRARWSTLHLVCRLPAGHGASSLAALFICFRLLTFGAYHDASTICKYHGQTTVLRWYSEGMDQTIKLKTTSRLIRRLLPILGVYIALGMVFYHVVEKWGWFDSLYFTVITLATVGYGDFTPQTVLGKAFTMFYIFIGIGLFVFVTNIFLRHQALRRVEANKNRDQQRQEKTG